MSSPKTAFDKMVAQFSTRMHLDTDSVRKELINCAPISHIYIPKCTQETNIQRNREIQQSCTDVKTLSNQHCLSERHIFRIKKR